MRRFTASAASALVLMLLTVPMFLFAQGPPAGQGKGMHKHEAHGGGGGCCSGKAAGKSCQGKKAGEKSCNGKSCKGKGCHIEASAVPQAVQEAAANIMGQAPEHWKKPCKPAGTKHYLAIGPGKDRYRFDEEGTLVLTCTHSTNAKDLPKAVKKAIARDYPGKELKHSARLQHEQSGTVVYKVHLVGQGAKIKASYNEQGEPVERKAMHSVVQDELEADDHGPDDE